MSDVTPLTFVEQIERRCGSYMYVMAHSPELEKDNKIRCKDDEVLRTMRQCLKDGEINPKVRNKLAELTFYFETKPPSSFKNYDDRRRKWNINNQFLARQYIIRSLAMMKNETESDRLFKESWSY